MKVEVRPFQDDDYWALLYHMRPADWDEVEKISGDVPKAVRMSIKTADTVWTGTIDDKVACVFGINPVSLLSDSGCPWMLGTPVLDKHPKLFMRYAREYNDRIKRTYSTLKNYVDVENIRAIRWLRALGFTFEAPVPLGTGVFYPFHWERSSCV